jgi:L-ascorbate metabolism protein UlaG (beta-lactamase superfamily)
VSRRQHGVGAPDRLTFAGHATVLLELGGRRFLTDPVLRTRLVHLRRVVAPPAGDLIADLDAVLLSHLHHDHLDLPSLKRVDRSVPVVTARGAGRLARRAGFTDVIELRAGDTVEIAGIPITATFADHDGRRLPRGPRIPALGYVIGASPRIYFAGDTDLFAGMANLGDLDVALLPVWGWGPSLGAGHLPPERAAKALTLLEPRMAVPIHWGTLRPVGLAGRMRDLLVDPPHAFAREAARLAPGVRVEVLEPGAAIELTGRPGPNPS